MCSGGLKASLAACCGRRREGTQRGYGVSEWLWRRAVRSFSCAVYANHRHCIYEICLIVINAVWSSWTFLNCHFHCTATGWPTYASGWDKVRAAYCTCVIFFSLSLCFCFNLLVTSGRNDGNIVRRRVERAQRSTRQRTNFAYIFPFIRYISVAVSFRYALTSHSLFAFFFSFARQHNSLLNGRRQGRANQSVFHLFGAFFFIYMLCLFVL